MYSKGTRALTFENVFAEYAQSPFFGEFVQGLFVRVTLGTDFYGCLRYLDCVYICMYMYYVCVYVCMYT